MSNAPSLFDLPPASPAPATFDGATYSAPHDAARLGRQALDVWHLMRDGRWRTLAEIASATGHPEASVSARLRDFRKPRCGGHQVEHRRRGEPSAGVWEYRLVVGEGVTL